MNSAHRISSSYWYLASIPGLLPPVINCIATFDPMHRKKGEGLEKFRHVMRATTDVMSYKQYRIVLGI